MYVKERRKVKVSNIIVTLEMTLYHISSNKCQGAYFKFQLKEWVLIRRRALNQVAAYFFPLNKLENGPGVPRKFTAFYTERAAIR